MPSARIDKDTWIIRFTHGGKRYAICHGKATNKSHKALMESIAAQVTLDISLGQLDTSLAKYKPWAVSESESESDVLLVPLQCWDDWVWTLEDNGLSATSVRTRYQPIRRVIQYTLHDFSIKCVEDLIDLLPQGVKPSTYNGRLAILKKWDKWLRDTKQVDWHGFDSYSPRQLEQREKPKPFTREELTLIHATAQKDARFSSYHAFICFLIGTGCRPSEAIGLRWQDLDFTRNQVTISTSLRRADDGSASGKNRVRDTTKTGTTRIIPLVEGLCNTLRSSYYGRQGLPTKYPDLVFMGTNGEPVNDEYFRKHVWKPLLKECGIPYQRPYVLRHTLISHLIESGASLVQAAAIAGHADTTMVSRVYGHMVNLPTMPEL